MENEHENEHIELTEEIKNSLTEVFRACTEEAMKRGNMEGKWTDHVSINFGKYEFRIAGKTVFGNVVTKAFTETMRIAMKAKVRTFNAPMV